MTVDVSKIQPSVMLKADVKPREPFNLGYMFLNVTMLQISFFSFFKPALRWGQNTSRGSAVAPPLPPLSQLVPASSNRRLLTQDLCGDVGPCP